MKLKNLILVIPMLVALNSNAQTKSGNDEDDHLTERNDSTKSSNKWKFGSESQNVLLVEKFEVAAAWNHTGNEALQILFGWPLGTGRVFATGSQEEKGLNFLDATMDFTYGNWPVDFGYSMGNDQTGHNPNLIYMGPNVTFMPSDFKSIHKVFNILRFSVIYPTFTKSVGLSNDSISHFNSGLEYLLFFQTKQIEKGVNGFDYFVEGLLKVRGEKSVCELELGLRNHKLLDNKLGVGIKFFTNDFNLEDIQSSLVIRYNVGNTNPRGFSH
ncbi:MAG: hypothetical protein NTX85_03005 [Candidatus Nomurabacteria bacterium]|nr:hypothetical protein [Candidatus Nomurabacteria bacterium]